MKRRYQYGPTGDVLFEQVFNATGNPTLQAEQDLLVPLGDHQHTTWLALAHAVDDSIYVRQSYDVSAFGRDVTTLGADSLPAATISFGAWRRASPTRQMGVNSAWRIKKNIDDPIVEDDWAHRPKSSSSRPEIGRHIKIIFGNLRIILDGFFVETGPPIPLT